MLFRSGGGAGGGGGGGDSANGGGLLPGGGSDAVAAAKNNAQGKTFVNAWKGDADELPTSSAWKVKSLSDAAAGSIASDAKPTATTTTKTPDAGSANQITYDGRVAAILNGQCASCHSPSGSQSGTPMDTYESAKSLGAGIVARAGNGGGMPPGGSEIGRAHV